MFDVQGSIKHYAWGDPEAIPRLHGVAPDGLPWAEWWLGTHPGGPASIRTDAGWEPLAGHAGPLPYLAKVLAAATPLSLQTHPDSATAASGFAREQAIGIPLDAPERTYRDPFAKPEILCALTPFDALCGFRPVEQSAAMLRSLGCRTTERLADRLERDGLAATLRFLLLDPPPIVEGVVAACRAHRGEHEAVTGWVAHIADLHPGDPALAVVPLMHVIRLMPGEAIYLTPGNVHAYLHGVGVEVMGPSDNVLRAGFTEKFIDRYELLRVVDPTPLADPRVEVEADADGGLRYLTPGAPFRLTRIELAGRRELRAGGPELLIATNGDAGSIASGQAKFVDAGERYSLEGAATVFRVEVGEAVAASAAA